MTVCFVHVSFLSNTVVLSSHVEGRDSILSSQINTLTLVPGYLTLLSSTSPCMQAHIPSPICTRHINLKKIKERKKKVNNQDQIERTIFAMIDNHFGITPACLPFADYITQGLRKHGI